MNIVKEHGINITYKELLFGESIPDTIENIRKLNADEIASAGNSRYVLSDETGDLQFFTTASEVERYIEEARKIGGKITPA